VAQLLDKIRELKRRPANAIRQWRYRQDVLSRFKARYGEFQKNPCRQGTQDAQALLREAFIATQGKSLDWAWRVQRERTRSVKRQFSSVLFPDLTESQANQATAALHTDGFFVLPYRLPVAWVNAVTERARQLPVEGRSGAEDVQLPATIQPKCPTYWHRQDDLLAVPEIREFMQDPALREIASRYLECEPVLDIVGAWWTFPQGEADSASAQLYHFDLDRVRWLKIFVYLTDVDEASGPHAFIRGSHRTIGQKICRDGRFSNDEVFAMYSKSDEMIFTAPSGTVILEDTLGFHKGVPATQGHRFILEYELSINHFGYPYPALPFDN
jgi:hypothetical protein